VDDEHDRRARMDDSVRYKLAGQQNRIVAELT